MPYMLTEKVFVGLILTTLDINDIYLRKDNVRGRKRQLNFNSQKVAFRHLLLRPKEGRGARVLLLGPKGGGLCVLSVLLLGPEGGGACVLLLGAKGRGACVLLLGPKGGGVRVMLFGPKRGGARVLLLGPKGRGASVLLLGRKGGGVRVDLRPSRRARGRGSGL